MATLRFKDIGIKAISACVPKGKVFNKDLISLMPEEEVKKVIDSVGIIERRIADDNITAADLCYEAAKKLMEDNHIDPLSIDMLLFMSQGADFRIPATSCILQDRLGLSKNCAAIDLSLGCSGYVYALSCAFAYASLPDIKRILLLDGETFSKIVNRKDKVNWPLYGDAGTATLIEKGDYGDSLFLLHTDGAGKNSVIIPGGMRNLIKKDSLVVKEREDGNFRSDLEVFMDGMEVFNFAIREVPKAIKELIRVSGKELSEIDFVIFHQSNRFMTDFFAKKLKLPANKLPYSIDRFGNTSSASIPLTIVTELKDNLDGIKNLILCGFGAGLSWATAKIPFKDCSVSSLVEL